MTEKSEGQVIWVTFNRNSYFSKVQTQSDFDNAENKEFYAENGFKRYILYSTFKETEAKLKSDVALAVEALEAIKLVAFENMEGQTHLSREYEIAKDALGKIGEEK